MRITDQAGRWYEVFLSTSDVDNLVDMLTDDPTVWGWQLPQSDRRSTTPLSDDGGDPDGGFR